MEAFLGDKIRNNDESLGALDESVEITLLVYKEDNNRLQHILMNLWLLIECIIFGNT